MLNTMNTGFHIPKKGLQLYFYLEQHTTDCRETPNIM